jgi:FkbM family methyltransferase
MIFVKRISHQVLRTYVFLAISAYWLFRGDLESLKFLLRNRINSTSQIYQDLHAAVIHSRLNDGNPYFVEFGATDGISLSNSFFLETRLNWKGILAEPGRSWYPSLRLNRTANISEDCVWSESGQNLDFLEASNLDLSGLAVTSTEFHKSRISGIKTYSVKTISLNDLLEFYNAPHHIAFLSIDTEGSEYEILKSLSFDKWKFDFIACEHNFQKNRELVKDLMNSNGYKRHLVHASLWDDWYIRKNR